MKKCRLNLPPSVMVLNSMCTMSWYDEEICLADHRPYTWYMLAWFTTGWKASLRSYRVLLPAGNCIACYRLWGTTVLCIITGILHSKWEPGHIISTLLAVTEVPRCSPQKPRPSHGSSFSQRCSLVMHKLAARWGPLPVRPHINVTITCTHFDHTLCPHSLWRVYDLPCSHNDAPFTTKSWSDIHSPSISGHDVIH